MANRGSKNSIFIRNMRQAGWFWAHNELVDVFAPLVGPFAIAVYVCLTRRCEGNSAVTQWSLRELERVWLAEDVPGVQRAALSRSSIARALAQLVAAGMIRVESPATRTRGPVYVLPNLPEVAASLTPELREKLAVRLEQQKDRGVPEGDTFTPVQELLKSGGKASGKVGISTEIPGTHVSPREPQVSPTGTLSIKDSNTNNTPPLPPQGGCVFSFLSSENLPIPAPPHVCAVPARTEPHSATHSGESAND